MEDYNELIRQRFKKLDELREMGAKPYAGGTRSPPRRRGFWRSTVPSAGKSLRRAGSPCPLPAGSWPCGASARPVSATSRTGRAGSSSIFRRTRSARGSSASSRSSISGISSASKGPCSALKPMSSPSTRKTSPCCRSRSGPCRKSGTALRTWSYATANGMSTSS